MRNRFDREEDYRLPQPALLEDSNTHLWAVSYSDLLMVLLSFFIMFFSFGDDKAGTLNLLKEISVSMQGSKSGEAPTQGAGAPGARSSSQTELATAKAGMESALVGVDGLNLKRSGDDSLMIHINETLFDPGSATLLPRGKQILSATLQKLIPYRDRIVIDFRGHADRTPFNPNRTDRVATNNLDISALRATNSLRFAETLGFDSGRMTASGAAEHQLGLRTLSLSIQFEKQGQEGGGK